MIRIIECGIETKALPLLINDIPLHQWPTIFLVTLNNFYKFLLRIVNQLFFPSNSLRLTTNRLYVVI